VKGNELRVGIGEVQVRQGNEVLVAYGVGSCVVIMLYDTKKQVGGLAHCLLPSGNKNSLKYPRGAIEEIIRQMSALGVNTNKLVAKIVGGATMFEGFERHAIGRRNIKRAREELDRIDIPVIAEDVFGTWGRSVFFHIESGEVRINSYRHGSKIL